MSIKPYILTFLLVAPLVSFSQNISTHFGPKQKTPPRTEISFVGGNENELRVLKTQSTGLLGRNKLFFLEKYDAKHQVVSKSELRMPNTNGHELTFEGVELFKDKLNLFTSYFNKRDSMNVFFSNSINEKGIVDADYKQLDEIYTNRKRNAGGFNYYTSKDSSKILIVHHNPFIKGKKETFACKVLDQSFNTIWTKEFELPIRDEQFEFIDFAIDNNGKVYIIGSADAKKSNLKKMGDLYTILSYDPGNDVFSQFDLDLGKYIIEIAFEVNSQNDLICVGFYSDVTRNATYSWNRKTLTLTERTSIRNTTSHGIFVVKIDGNTQTVKHKNIQEFDKKAVALFTSQRGAEKNKGIVDLHINRLILKDNGGIVLLAEQDYVTVTVTQNPSTSSSMSPSGVRRPTGKSTSKTYNFYYNNIIAISIAPDAGIEWQIPISKNQLTKNDQGFFSSYASFVYDDIVYLIYNDHPQNLKITDVKKRKIMKTPKKSVAVVTTIDTQGNFKSSQLFNSKSQGVVIRPKSNLDTNTGKLMIVGYENKGANPRNSKSTQIGSIEIK